MKRETKGQILPVIFMVLIVVTLSILFTSCSKVNDNYCKVVKYVEVEGNLVKIDEMPCGCFPKVLDEGKVVTFNNVEYAVIERYECY